MRNLADILLLSKLQACRCTSIHIPQLQDISAPTGDIWTKTLRSVVLHAKQLWWLYSSQAIAGVFDRGSLPLRLIYTTYNHVTRKKVFPLYYQKDCVLTWWECDNECSHGDIEDNVLFLWSHEEFLQVKMKGGLSQLCTVAVNRNVIPWRPLCLRQAFWMFLLCGHMPTQGYGACALALFNSN